MLVNLEISLPPWNDPWAPCGKPQVMSVNPEIARFHQSVLGGVPTLGVGGTPKRQAESPQRRHQGAFHAHPRSD